MLKIALPGRGKEEALQEWMDSGCSEMENVGLV